jgi:hypothetical protein
MFQGLRRYPVSTRTAIPHLKVQERRAARKIKDAVVCNHTVKVQRGEVVRRERLMRELEVLFEIPETDPEHLDLAPQSTQNPAGQVRRAGRQEPVEIEVVPAEEEVARLEMRVAVSAAAAQAKQTADEAVELISAPEPLDLGDEEAWRGHPEVAPAPGKDARTHGLVRRQERQQVVE